MASVRLVNGETLPPGHTAPEGSPAQMIARIRSGVFDYVLHRIAHGLDCFNILVGNGDAKL